MYIGCVRVMAIFCKYSNASDLANTTWNARVENRQKDGATKPKRREQQAASLRCKAFHRWCGGMVSVGERGATLSPYCRTMCIVPDELETTKQNLLIE